MAKKSESAGASSGLLDPDEEALKAVVNAITNNCLIQGTTSAEEVQQIVDQYQPRYPSLTTDYIRGGLMFASGASTGSINQEVVASIHNNNTNNNNKNKKRPRQIKSDPTRKRICKFKDCTEEVHSIGLCAVHYLHNRPICSVEGCEGNVYCKGVCWTHGTYRKICSFEGCTHVARAAGLCYGHGATGKVCKVEGCEVIVKRGSVCKDCNNDNGNGEGEGEVHEEGLEEYVGDIMD